MDYEQARLNMIQNQIRTWDVLDQRVLDAFYSLKREDFVPENYRSLAFADLELPIGHGALMLNPKLQARLIQELRLTGGENILEIGTGTGFMTGILGLLGGKVTSVEISTELSGLAAKNLRKYSFPNVQLIVEDGMVGSESTEPYDVIIFTGSMPELPEVFKQQLNIGGRIVAAIGNPPVMVATVFTRLNSEVFDESAVFEAFVPPLVIPESKQLFEL